MIIDKQLWRYLNDMLLPTGTLLWAQGCFATQIWLLRSWCGSQWKADTFVDQSHAGCRSLRGFASGGCDECCNARTCALYKNVLYPKLGLSISWWMRAVLIRLRDAWPRRAAQSPPSPAGLAHGGLQQTDQTIICCEGSHDRSKLITVDSRIQ